MITRRTLLATSLASAGMLMSPTMSAEAAENVIELTEDGLHRQPWFIDSFLELADDLDTAAQNDKRFVVMWELKGCPYCRETHYVNFARPDINRFVRENFEILQLNIIGSRMVTDFDGEELPEKALAGKYGVRFTPTIQFFPQSGAGLIDKLPRKREVARAPGYLMPDHFLKMFQFVKSKAYERESFRAYLRSAQ